MPTPLELSRDGLGGGYILDGHTNIITCVCVKEMEFITHLKWVHMSISTLKWVYIVLIFIVYISRNERRVNLFECLFFCCSVAVVVAGFITAHRLPLSDILIKIEKFTRI